MTASILVVIAILVVNIKLSNYKEQGIIDDLEKPLEYYRIIKSNTWTHLDETEYRTENIGFIANLDADKELELLISNGYYEYRDYSIVNLS